VGTYLRQGPDTFGHQLHKEGPNKLRILFKRNQEKIKSIIFTFALASLSLGKESYERRFVPAPPLSWACLSVFINSSKSSNSLESRLLFAFPLEANERRTVNF